MSARVARVALLLQVEVGDPADLMTWRLGGRPLTAGQLRLLHAMTLEDVQDAADLRALDVEVDRSFNEHLGDG